MSGIKDKVVAITGASSGIGEATALLLAERGAKLAIGARRSERLVALADRIAKAGGEAVYALTDVKRTITMRFFSFRSPSTWGERRISAGLTDMALFRKCRCTLDDCLGFFQRETHVWNSSLIGSGCH